MVIDGYENRGLVGKGHRLNEWMNATSLAPE